MKDFLGFRFKTPKHKKICEIVEFYLDEEDITYATLPAKNINDYFSIEKDLFFEQLKSGYITEYINTKNILYDILSKNDV